MDFFIRLPYVRNEIHREPLMKHCRISCILLAVAVGCLSCRSVPDNDYQPPSQRATLGLGASDPTAGVGASAEARERTAFDVADGVPAVAATGPMRISLEEAVMLTLENNRSLRVQRMAPIVAGTFEDVARSAFDPNLFAELSVSRRRDERLADTLEPVTDASESFNASVGLNQSFPTGTDVQLGATQSFRNPRDGGFDTDRVRGFVTVTQALLDGRGTEVNLAQVRQARLDTLASEFELRGFAEALLADIESAYWDYVLARREAEIFEESVDLARRQMEATRERIEVGQLAETEIAAAEAEVALRRQALINARSRLEVLRLRLIRFLNPQPGEDGWDREIEVVDDPSVPDVELDDVRRHVQVALRFRPEIHQSHLQLTGRGLDVVQTRNGLLPRLDFFVTLGKTGFANSFGDAIQNIDGDGYDATVGIRAEYALGNRQSDANHRRARANQRQANESIRNLVQLVELDVRTAYTEARRAEQQIEASAATRRLQEEALRAETEKFEVGLSTVLEVSQVQRDLLESQIAEVGAVIDYRKAVIDLYRLEGSLLKRRGIGGPGDREISHSMVENGYR